MNAPSTTNIFPPPSPSASALQAVQEAVQHAGQGGSAASLQCTLAAASDAVRLALEQESLAEEAALSLGQREIMDRLRAELSGASEALSTALDARGRRVVEPPHAAVNRWGLRLPFSLSERPSRSARTEAPSWWFALSEAIEVLGEGVERLDRLASGQPELAPSRAIAEATAELLRGHHACLLRQAERWLA
jgi:hypothetical protein